jgi:cell division protein FtsN
MKPTRFAVAFGPFASAAEAERVERTLIRAGHETLRTRGDAGPTLYAVLIERVASAAEARAMVNVLREQGLEATVAGEPPVVRVGDPRPLRGAVETAARVRKAGYQVRVAAQPGGGGAGYTIRHGSFATRDEAEARSRQLARLGVPAPQVVPVR